MSNPFFILGQKSFIVKQILRPDCTIKLGFCVVGSMFKGVLK